MIEYNSAASYIALSCQDVRLSGRVLNFIAP